MKRNRELSSPRRLRIEKRLSFFSNSSVMMSASLKPIFRLHEESSTLRNMGTCGALSMTMFNLSIQENGYEEVVFFLLDDSSKSGCHYLCSHIRQTHPLHSVIQRGIYLLCSEAKGIQNVDSRIFHVLYQGYNKRYLGFAS